MIEAVIPAAAPIIGEPERAAVERVLASGMLAQGREVAAFEDEFGNAVANGRLAVAVNSGTAALHLGLLAAGIGPGDEVIVPSFTFAATANSVALTGATPVFADIDLATFCLDPASVAMAVTPATRGVMPVHLYGLPADLKSLRAICEQHGLMLFEDAAQAHLASVDGEPVGSFGEFGAFSLYPTKNMTSGEGGMITTASDQLARNARMLRNQGMERRYENEVIGFNARMTDLHAAIGRAQLERLQVWTDRRRQVAAQYDSELAGVVTPVVPAGRSHSYHQYTIRLEGASAAERDKFAAALLAEHGVASGVYYPTPNHRLPSLARFAPGLELPVTERAAAECLSIPVHPSLSEADVQRVIGAVNRLAGGRL